MITKSIKSFIWKRLAEKMGLKYRLPCGINISIESYSDWCIYNDLFAVGEYDDAILMALESEQSSSFRFVDLGANLGFFPLRVMHLALTKLNKKVPMYGLLIEATPTTCNELTSRMGSIPKDLCNMEILNTVVGKLSGYAEITAARASSGNSVTSEKGQWRVPYVNLLEHKFCQDPISLIKCDIEGSEVDFLENYQSLIKNSRVFILECHPPFYNKNQAIDLMEELGMKLGGITRDVTEGQTVWFYKK